MLARLMVALVISAALALLLGCGNNGAGSGGDGGGAADIRLESGSAVLELSHEARRKFERLGLRITAAGEGSRIGGRPAFTFPVEGGRLDRLTEPPLDEPALYGVVELGGSLRFTSDEGEAVLRDLTITTRRNGVLATAGELRALMFNLEQPRFRRMQSGVIAGRFGMELTATGEVAIEDATEAAVAPGGNLGQLEVRALPDRQLPG